MSRSILIVEDDVLMAEIMATVVGAEKTVTTLAEAMNQIRQKSFDLVLLDLKLPDSTQMATLAAIPEMKSLGVRNVVVITGSPVDERLLKAGLEAGATDVIGKDVDLKSRLASLSGNP